MNYTDFQKEISREKMAVVVEFWASWCGPCRAMEPGLKSTAKSMEGRVRLWRINADQNPDVLRGLKVMGIPTMIGYKSGKEVTRRTGALPPAGIRKFFEAVEIGEAPKTRLSVLDRVVRLAIAAIFIALGTMHGVNYWFLGIGAIALFSAVYDRCPIYKAVAPKIRQLFRR